MTFLLPKAMNISENHLTNVFLSGHFVVALLMWKHVRTCVRLATPLVMERRMPWSGKYGMSLWSISLDTVREVRHSLVNYISLDIDDIVTDCVSSLSLVILYTSFLAFCCTSASAYTRNKVIIIMALTWMIFYM